MSNKFKNKGIKSYTRIKKELKYTKIHAKIFLFTTLIRDDQRFEILKKWMDTLTKLIKIRI